MKFSMRSSPGHAEKIYQKALSVSFKESNLKFIEQVKCDVYFKGKVVARGYLDFRVEEKIIVELKKDD